MKKQYKECSPDVTILNIKKILNDIGVITNDSHMRSGKFFSSRINIANSNLNDLGVGTNGKGRTFEYSMASGYAELIERLANRLLFDQRIYATKDYLSGLDSNSEYVKKINDSIGGFDFIYFLLFWPRMGRQFKAFVGYIFK